MSSQNKAEEAIKAGLFKAEIVPVEVCHVLVFVLLCLSLVLSVLIFVLLVVNPRVLLAYGVGVGLFFLFHKFYHSHTLIDISFFETPFFI